MRGGQDEVVQGLGSAEVVPLHFVDADGAQRCEFGLGFDALRDDAAADFVRKRDQAFGESALTRVAVYVARQAHVELDDVRLQIQDVPHASEAGTSVVDGKKGASCAEGFKGTP